MASLNNELKISVETLIHNALLKFAEQVDELHGVKINSVRFDWESCRTMNGIKYGKIVSITLDSSINK